jgi:hypothetical protein
VSSTGAVVISAVVVSTVSVVVSGAVVIPGAGSPPHAAKVNNKQTNSSRETPFKQRVFITTPLIVIGFNR